MNLLLRTISIFLMCAYMKRSIICDKTSGDFVSFNNDDDDDDDDDDDPCTSLAGYVVIGLMFV